LREIDAGSSVDGQACNLSASVVVAAGHSR
jgi:hypothetical protein